MFQNKTNKASETGFPLSQVQYEALQPQKKLLIRKILYLFVFYASKGSKHTFSQLHEHNFMDLMTNIWSASGRNLQRNKGTWKQLQIMYYTKGCKNKLSFKNYLDMLPSLSCTFEPQLNREQALKSLIYHSNNVYQSKVLPQIQHKLVNTKQIIAEDTRIFLSKLAPQLTKLYKVYFPHQITHKCKAKHFKQLSFQCFMECLKQFQVYPKVISARDIFYIFNEACQSGTSQLLYDTQQSRAVVSQLGQILTLSKFIQSLIIVSRRALPKLKSIDNEQDWEDEQKYILRTLLEYMQTVKMSNKKPTKFQHQRMCFIVLDEHPPQQMTKTVHVKDKIIRETVTNMDFYTLMERIKF